MKATADRIKEKLIPWIRGTGYEVIIPNFYMGSYEMDVFRLMESGFVVEYEIKISKSDFKADFNKGQGGFRSEKTYKHDEIKAGKLPCNRFVFVVPEYLITKEECPEYAGLIYFSNNGRLSIVKNAPLIHKNKQEEKIYKSLAKSLSFRETIIRQKMNYWKSKFENK